MYCSILRREAYEVATAVTGLDGLALIEADEAHFDLILVDLRLPDASGLEVLMAAVERDMPAVVLTAFGMRISETAARKLGAADFVAKPFNADDLVQIVRRNLAEAKLRTSRPRRPSEMLWPMGHAAERWTSIVVPVTRFACDVPTLGGWGRRVGKSPATLKTWCAGVGVHAGDSLDFARFLRVVVQFTGRQCTWFEVLDIVDPRTLARLRDRAGLSTYTTIPDLQTFLRNQQFLTAVSLLAAVTTLLSPPPVQPPRD
jgi:CheY-like chemotaxis protein